MIAATTLPEDHLDRLFGRDLRSAGWQVDVPAPANDDDLINIVDPSFILSLLKRRGR